ncbi:MAG: hypothetical protein WCR42_13230 [bacterium]
MQVYDILDRQSMGQDYFGDWFPLNYIKMKAVSVQVVWTAGVGTMDGILEISVSNQPPAGTLVQRIAINSADNESDCLILMLNPQFSYIRFNFLKHRIIAGELSISIVYE